MLDLYWIPGAASLAVHALLEEAGVEYRLHRVVRDNGKVQPAEFRKLSPHGRVPTVVLDGGLVMYESAAIVMHLSDLYPEAGLAPAPGTPERALWYRWLTYFTNTVQATFMIFIYPERYTAEGADAEPVKERAEASLVGMRDFLEGELAAGGPYVLGERFSSADLYLWMLTRWGRRLEPKWSGPPELGAHWRRVRERPAAQRVYEQEGLEE